MKDQGQKNDILERVFRWVSDNHEKMCGKTFNSISEIEGEEDNKKQAP